MTFKPAPERKEKRYTEIHSIPEEDHNRVYPELMFTLSKKAGIPGLSRIPVRCSTYEVGYLGGFKRIDHERELAENNWSVYAKNIHQLTAQEEMTHKIIPGRLLFLYSLHIPSCTSIAEIPAYLATFFRN